MPDSSTCQVFPEEAYLKGDLKFKNFYKKIWSVTSCDWIGPPKGQIEPVKETQADEKEHALFVKSRRIIALERGYDYDAMVDQIDEEEEDLIARGINTQE